eukprot:1167368-Pyramimonas_sp.AAC.1
MRLLYTVVIRATLTVTWNHQVERKESAEKGSEGSTRDRVGRLTSHGRGVPQGPQLPIVVTLTTEPHGRAG